MINECAESGPISVIIRATDTQEKLQAKWATTIHPGWGEVKTKILLALYICIFTPCYMLILGLVLYIKIQIIQDFIILKYFDGHI